MVASSLLAVLSSCNTAIPGLEVQDSVFIKRTETGYRLIRNGEPFFIQGAAGNAYLKELKNAGGNTIRVYQPEDLPDILEEAEKLDIAVIADIPIPKAIYPEFYTAPEKFQKIKNNVAGIVSAHKNHPALLYWNLGNEIMYPIITDRSGFFEKYNELIALIHELDPKHPVSTAVIGGNRRRLTSIAVNSPELDFLSFNTFGNLHELEERMKSISLIWDDPYVISEWGINGPWEEKTTSWNAPIEQNNRQKSQTLSKRHTQYLLKMKQGKCMGNLVFYWGNKQETTPTWYSIFSEEGKKSPLYYEMANIWRKSPLKYSGPFISDASINDKHSEQNIILNAGEEAELKFQLSSSWTDRLEIFWELREEAWFDPLDLPKKIEGANLNGTSTKFKVPEKEGYYRLYVYVSNEEDFSSYNIPFYVINARNAQ